MDQINQEYKKKFVSTGQMFAAGELLNFTGYDISVKGIVAEMVPGAFLTDYEDFDRLIKESPIVQIFVKDLMLTGEAEIVWLNVESDGGILLGLEFRDVIYNAEKLWHKRRYFRKSKKAPGILIADEVKFPFESINISVDGIMICLTEDAEKAIAVEPPFSTGYVVKIISQELNVRALAKIAWIDRDTHTTMGLRYLQVDHA